MNKRVDNECHYFIAEQFIRKAQRGRNLYCHVTGDSWGGTQTCFARDIELNRDQMTVLKSGRELKKIDSVEMFQLNLHFLRWRHTNPILQLSISPVPLLI